MKKTTIILFTLALATTMTACSSNTSSSSSISSSSSSVNTEISSSSASSSGQSAENTSQVLYGKITSIVGNEIELSLANMPKDDDSTSKTESSSSSIDMGAVMDAATLVPATKVENFGEMLEYTGETISLTVPTGVTIKDKGENSKLTAMKKGSIISVVVDNVKDKNIKSIDILN